MSMGKTDEAQLVVKRLAALDSGLDEVDVLDIAEVDDRFVGEAFAASLGASSEVLVGLMRALSPTAGTHVVHPSSPGKADIS